MDYILDFQNDQNNGLSLISSFSYFTCSKWGRITANSRYMAVPAILTADNVWSIFTYRFDIAITEWIFSQIISTDFSLSPEIVIADVSDTHLSIINPISRKLYIYKLDNSSKWTLNQTIDTPHNVTINETVNLSVYNDIIVVSDWEYTSGLNTGAIFIYNYNTS